MGDTPPAAVIDRMAATFQHSDGDIAQVVRTMVRSPEFAGSLDHAFKDPVHYAVSAVRLAYGDRVILNAQPVIGWMNRMGEGLYNHETPDGYPHGVRRLVGGPGQLATPVRHRAPDRWRIVGAVPPGGCDRGPARVPAAAECAIL